MLHCQVLLIKYLFPILSDIHANTIMFFLGAIFFPISKSFNMDKHRLIMTFRFCAIVFFKVVLVSSLNVTSKCQCMISTEQPVLPADSKRTDCILTEIICKTAASILQIGLRCFLLVKDIIDCFIHAGIPHWASAYQATTRKPPEQVFPSRDAAAYAFHNHQDIFC